MIVSFVFSTNVKGNDEVMWTTGKICISPPQNEYTIVDDVTYDVQLKILLKYKYRHIIWK